MRTRTPAVLVSALLVLGAAALARGDGHALPAEPADEATLELLVDTIQSNKKALVAVNLVLEPDEAVAFWPVYDQYQAELDVVALRFVTLIRDYTQHYKTMDGDLSRRLVDEALAIEAARAALRQKYVEPFMKVLPGRKVARFYQMENKLHAVVRYEIARGIPVIPD